MQKKWAKKVWYTFCLSVTPLSRRVGDCGGQVQVCVTDMYVQLLSQKSSGPLTLCPSGRRNGGSHPRVGYQPTGIPQVPLQAHKYAGPGACTRHRGKLTARLQFNGAWPGISFLHFSLTCPSWRSTAWRPSVSLSPSAKRRENTKRSASPAPPSVKLREATWRARAGAGLRCT